MIFQSFLGHARRAWPRRTFLDTAHRSRKPRHCMLASSCCCMLLGLMVCDKPAYGQIHVSGDDEWVHCCVRCMCRDCLQVRRVEAEAKSLIPLNFGDRDAFKVLVIDGQSLDPMIMERLGNQGIRVVVYNRAYENREYQRRRKFIEDLAEAIIEVCPLKKTAVEVARDMQLELLARKFLRGSHRRLEAT